MREKSPSPSTRAAWNALPADGSYMLVRDVAKKTGMSEMAIRAQFKLLKDRELADSRPSNVAYMRNRFLVEWRRTVETLP